MPTSSVSPARWVSVHTGVGQLTGVGDNGGYSRTHVGREPSNDVGNGRLPRDRTRGEGPDCCPGICIDLWHALVPEGEGHRDLFCQCQG